MIYRFFCLLIICCTLPGCAINSIPLKDQMGNTIRSIWLQQQGSAVDIRLPPETERVAVLSLSMSQPVEEVVLEILAEDDVLIEKKNITFPMGVREGILDFQFNRVPEAVKLRIQGTSMQTVPELFSLALHDEYSGLVVRDYHIVLPENMRYRQEVHSPQPGSSESPVIYQDVYLDDILKNFDHEKYIPILELAYEYDRAEEGMPVAAWDLSGQSDTHDHDHPDHGSDTFLPPNSPLARIEFVSEELNEPKVWELRLRPGVQRVYFYPEMFVTDPGIVRFVHDSVYGRLHSLRLIQKERHPPSLHQLEPLPIDLGILMDYSSALWRQEDFELFNWNLFPEVLIFDFADYDVQARFFRRLAYYVEKIGFRGSILTDAELENRHGWNAHNYHPRDLARFYNQVFEKKMELNEEEEFLRELLLERGVLLYDGIRYEEGEGQIISVSSHPLQTAASRRLFLNHEALHGVFYNFPSLQETSSALWADLDSDSREYITEYLSYVSYDRDDEYLMVNEFQAYMLQQELSELRWVVQTRMSDRLARYSPQLRGFLDRTKVQAGDDAVMAAEILQTLIYQNLGLVAGDFFCLVEK